MKHEIQRIEKDDLLMDFFKFGRGERSLVVLPGVGVKSVMESADLIAEDYKSMADDFTIYVLDVRKNLPKGYYIKDLACDAVTAVRAIGLEKSSFFGASQGGMLGMEIAIHEPRLVDKLILGSTSAKVTDEQFKIFGGWIDKAREKNAEDLLLAFGKDIYPEKVFLEAQDQIIELAKL